MKEHFKSAFEVCLGKEPEFTTLKYSSKEPEGKKRTIDYVFYKSSTTGGNPLKPIGYYALPKTEDIFEEIGNPCINYPSDHYAIGFEIQI